MDAARSTTLHFHSLERTTMMFDKSSVFLQGGGRGGHSALKVAGGS